MKDTRNSSYFDTNYMTVLQIEQILHNFEDQKFANFFNREQVDFLVILVKCLVRSGRYQDPVFHMQQIAITLQFGANNDNNQSEKCACVCN